MYVSQTLCKVFWHVFIKILVTFTCFFKSHVDELLSRILVDVILKPWKIKAIQTKSDEVEQRFDIVYRPCFWIYLKFANGGKHRVSFKLGNFPLMFGIYSLSKRKIDQIISSVSEANIIKL